MYFLRAPSHPLPSLQTHSCLIPLGLTTLDYQRIVRNAIQGSVSSPCSVFYRCKLISHPVASIWRPPRPSAARAYHPLAWLIAPVLRAAPLVWRVPCGRQATRIRSSRESRAQPHVIIQIFIPLTWL